MINHESEQETQLRRYLLGELDLKDQVLVEERLFLESQYAELAQAIEDDLVDDYVHNDLTESERKNFEKHFLVQPEQSANLKIARALDQYFAPGAAANADQPEIVPDERQPSNVVALFRTRRVVWLSLAAALLVALFIVTWMVMQSLRRPKQLEAKEQPAPTQPVNQPSPGPSLPDEKKDSVETVEQRDSGSTPKERPPKDRGTGRPGSPTIVTIMPGLGTRGGGTAGNVVKLHSADKEVTLRLPVSTADTYDKYRVELRSSGRLVRSSVLKSETDKELGPVVFFTIPAKVLTQQRYEVTMRGIPFAGSSSDLMPHVFTVEKIP